MSLASLLQLHLKDDEVIEILETYEMSVTYQFDRSHENMPDVYWAPARRAGFQLRFNEQQILDTIFCYLAAKEGFDVIERKLIGVPVYETFAEAERACKKEGLAYKTSDSKKGPKYHQAWLRIDSPEIKRHYQFKDKRIAMVTLMAPDM